MKDKRKILTIISLILFVILLFIMNRTFDSYEIRILNLCGIYVVLGLSLNLINGFTGLFSLGHAGFMAIGAYTSAIFTMSPELKQMNYYLKPIIPIFKNIQLPFLPSLLIAGLMAGLIGFLIAAPVLRLKDDYLAIATLGFSEIIRVVFTNTQSLTNGALGLKGLPKYTNVWWSWGMAIGTVIFMVLLIKGSYGRALMAIREDEIAAEAMGIDLFRHKIISFTIGSFLAGVGGALLAHLLGTIDPLMFRFLLTFNILLIVVLGGIGSITGTVISAVVVTVLMEFLRVLDGTMDLGFIRISGIPGMRMVVFSALLMFVILFYQRGIMGTKEFTWDWILNRKKKYTQIKG
ncbi:branched-chain amino acid ABC transporter permease [Thermohalobacter berrensis]|uniref:ABC transporter permease n=1 Tax=Thermohalobacter berrensis TaxID=99594 RepID=A0A419SY16_9FIRM|nr:branched-chain amino acid ABC transporter permease [Thermohalobacter berrensis]RKD30098.1 ABC transporter permease [Thermohalobacter berrensis]